MTDDPRQVDREREPASVRDALEALRARRHPDRHGDRPVAPVEADRHRARTDTPDPTLEPATHDEKGPR